MLALNSFYFILLAISHFYIPVQVVFYFNDFKGALCLYFSDLDNGNVAENVWCFYLMKNFLTLIVFTTDLVS